MTEKVVKPVNWHKIWSVDARAKYKKLDRVNAVCIDETIAALEKNPFDNDGEQPGIPDLADLKRKKVEGTLYRIMFTIDKRTHSFVIRTIWKTQAL